MSPVFVCSQLAPLAAADAAPRQSDPIALIAIALGAMILVYFTVLRPRARKANKPDPLATPPSQRQSLAGERAAERQMQMLLVELEQMSRQMSAQLDTKAARLDALIREADAKISALNAGLAKAKSGRLVDGLVAGTLGPAAESGLAALARHKEIYDLADAGESSRAIAGKLKRPTGEVELILALRGTGGAIG